MAGDDSCNCVPATVCDTYSGFPALTAAGPTLACIHFFLLSHSLSNKMDIFFKSDVKCFNKQKLNDTEEHTSTKYACETVPNECFVFVCVCVFCRFNFTFLGLIV